MELRMEFHVYCDDVERDGRSLDAIVIKEDEVQIWINEPNGGVSIINAFRVKPSFNLKEKER